MKEREAEPQLDQRAATSMQSCHDTMEGLISVSNGQGANTIPMYSNCHRPKKFSLMPRKTQKKRQKVPVFGVKQ